jgi:hypothetical protein
MTKPGVLLTLLLVVLSSAKARATDPPPECREGVYFTAYRAGFIRGGSIVSQAWDGLDESCWNVDLLHEAVSDSIASYRPSLERATGPFARRVNCQFGGHVVGMTERVDEIMVDCGAYCCERGAAMGGHFAHAYCLIAIAARGGHDPGGFIRPFVPYCGRHYEYCCTSASDEYASSWAECVPFIRYPYDDAFENYLEYTCAW